METKKFTLFIIDGSAADFADPDTPSFKLFGLSFCEVKRIIAFLAEHGAPYSGETDYVLRME